jgi:hypothetical protein
MARIAVLRPAEATRRVIPTADISDISGPPALSAWSVCLHRLGETVRQIGGPRC